jgi:DNA-binding transcriptional regulator YiaG
MSAVVRQRRLNALMSQHDLTSEKVATLLGRNASHVRAWMAGIRPLPPQMLRLLELELALVAK